MSLTLLYRGNNVRFSMKLAKSHWLSALLVFAIISGLVVHLMISADARPEKANSLMISTLLNQSDVTPKSSQQVTALTMKLAELQSQVSRLNALGERLAEQAKIPKNEFDFQTLPPTGGPLISAPEVNEVSLTELMLNTSLMANDLLIEEKQLKLLESISLGHHIESASYLSGRPIVKGWLSSYFGTRKDPFSGRPSMHRGLDFAGKEDDDIIATAAGVVSWAGDRFGYGKLIEINHGKGLKTRYGHNKKILINVGDVVSKGQVIGRMGSTGRSTGPHVHYEILHNNKQINPINYVYRKAK
jgi:murein DD-endopeptidase MepM/ murein hydrolase activator NlpD